MPWVLRAPEPPRRRLAAGTPSILTARQINRGIHFRETSSALRSSLQTRSLHIARSSKSRVRAPQQTWPCWLPKLPGESQKPSRHPHTRANLGWKEVGQAWTPSRGQQSLEMPWRALGGLQNTGLSPFAFLFPIKRILQRCFFVNREACSVALTPVHGYLANLCRLKGVHLDIQVSC